MWRLGAGGRAGLGRVGGQDMIWVARGDLRVSGGKGNMCGAWLRMIGVIIVLCDFVTTEEKSTNCLHV